MVIIEFEKKDEYEEVKSVLRFDVDCPRLRYIKSKECEYEYYAICAYRQDVIRLFSIMLDNSLISYKTCKKWHKDCINKSFVICYEY